MISEYLEPLAKVLMTPFGKLKTGFDTSERRILQLQHVDFPFVVRYRTTNGSSFARGSLDFEFTGKGFITTRNC